ncbi:patatin-like phospholipase family protein [Vibrio agarivorans]|uniref:patatin-like phospholipase family protein n=1 Tax=Vibrio agarivorans TaxID=153622 RepID=UPI0025B5609C|nr:patatin-like phospholipase family protein [Vibrio agarivorans]MDN3663256.1 patatin-like phospholipase family protein [Vibrio agarivorans]
MRKTLWTVLSLLTLVACSSTERKAIEISDDYAPLESEFIRTWDGDANSFDSALFNRYSREHFQNRLNQDGVVNYLALSGGGFNGAFSAGILTAWTEKGTRPEFDVVTGVSTGAIVSIFAFLGSDYDHVLKELYTETDFNDLFETNNVFSIFSEKALFDNSKFEAKVQSIINDQLVTEIAFESRLGRKLFIGTADLDHQRLAIWDIGRIAEYGSPKATRLIQDLIIASSSVPGAFPVRKIELNIEGTTFDELHVDGGIVRQVFFAPQWFDIKTMASGDKQNLYVLRNGTLHPKYKPTQISFFDISARSMDTLLLSQGVGDIEFIFHYAQGNNINFNLAYIGQDFPEVEGEDPMGKDYMQRLYQYSYRKKVNDVAWESVPPSIRFLYPPRR